MRFKKYTYNYNNLWTIPCPRLFVVRSLLRCDPFCLHPPSGPRNPMVYGLPFFLLNIQSARALHSPVEYGVLNPAASVG